MSASPEKPKAWTSARKTLAILSPPSEVLNLSNSAFKASASALVPSARVVPEECLDELGGRRGALTNTDRLQLSRQGTKKQVSAAADKSYKKLPVHVSHWKAPDVTDDKEEGATGFNVDEVQEAALRGDVGLVLKHVKAGAPVNTPLRVVGSDEYLTLLHILACKPDMPNSARLAGELIEAKADPNSRSTLGTSPLIYACYHKHIDVVQLLLESGAKTDSVDDHGLSPLCCAVLVNNINTGEKSISEAKQISSDLVELLFDYSVNLDDASGDATALVRAIEEQNEPAIESLLLCGASPPGLVLALPNMTLPTIKLLMEAMANPFTRNRSGLDSLEMLELRGDEELSRCVEGYVMQLERTRHPHLESRETVEKRQSMLRRSDMTKRLTSVIITGKDDEAAAEGFAFFALPVEEGDHLLRKYKPLVSAVRWTLKNPIVKGLFTTNLILALFLPDIWTILEVGQDSLDTLLIVIFCLFAIELLMNLYAFWSIYLGSFGFWTDVVGMLSVPLDHSYPGGVLMDALQLDGPALMRITKFVKLGARAGRLSRLVKLLRFLPSLRENLVQKQQQLGTARSITAELNSQLALRAASLAIIIVVFIPLTEFWRFPSEDLSMFVWLSMIDGYTRSAYPFSDVELKIQDLHQFYSDKNYFPYMLRICTQMNSTCTQQSDFMEYSLLGRQIPIRVGDIVIVRQPQFLTEIYFNFRGPNLAEAISTVTLIASVWIFISLSAGLVSGTVSRIVLRPLSDLLFGVEKVSASILITVEKLATFFVKDYASTATLYMHDDEIGSTFRKEVRLLKKVTKKVSVLNKIASAKRPVDEFEQLGAAQRHVLVDYTTSGARRHLVTMDREGDGSVQDLQETMHAADMKLLMDSIGMLLDEVELPRPEFDNWELDTIEINPSQRFALARSVLSFFDTVPGFPHGQPVDLKTFTTHGSFLSAVQECYMNKPGTTYHNWTHAVDIAFTMRQLFTLLPSKGFFTMEERFALLCCAFGHDLGHSGLTNSYLVESRDKLAVMYNDTSILQNHSCAEMFAIMNKSGCNIFTHFSTELQGDLRQLCVSAILYTDLTKHFSLMSQVSRMYEAKKELFELIRSYEPDPDATKEIEKRAQARMTRAQYDSSSVAEEDLGVKALTELEDYLWNADVKHTWRNFFLHFADHSNAMKPWELCGRWTDLLFQEFFQQGDAERALKLPLQPLNDRARVNVPYVQLQYITFFVATPSVLMAAMIPAMKMAQEYMWSNLDGWVRLWSEGAPDPDEQRRVVHRIALMQKRAEDFESVILPSEDDIPPTPVGHQWTTVGNRSKTPDSDVKASLSLEEAE